MTAIFDAAGWVCLGLLVVAAIRWTILPAIVDLLDCFVREQEEKLPDIERHG